MLRYRYRGILSEIFIHERGQIEKAGGIYADTLQGLCASLAANTATYC